MVWECYKGLSLYLYYLKFFFFFFWLFMAAPMAFGNSQVRGQIAAIAASLFHSHSNTVGSKPCLYPTPQLMATLDS